MNIDETMDRPVEVCHESVNSMTLRDASGDVVCELTEEEDDVVGDRMIARANWIAKALNEYGG